MTRLLERKDSKRKRVSATIPFSHWEAVSLTESMTGKKLGEESRLWSSAHERHGRRERGA
jgi:hypothetical protein